MASSDSVTEAGAAHQSVFRDRSFWGLTISQLLGSFNDNLFKQLVLLLCLDHAAAAVTDAAAGSTSTADRYQPIAMAVFALPWVLMSGLAGFVGDRTSKQKGIVIYKLLEIVVMTAGLLAFLSGQLWALFLVLFLMSTQSTFFGPAKYGSLPELFRSDDLPQINGVFQMTTFLAIIFGFASAGILKDLFPGQQGLALVSCFSIVIAVLGTGAALLVRRTPVAQPGLSLTWRSVGIDRDNWRLLTENRFLMGVLLVSALFWFTGGIVQPAVNSLGNRDLGLSDSRTSILQACMGVGIAFGCAMSGKLSRHRVRFGLVTVGAWGMVLGLPVLTALSYFPTQSVSSTDGVLNAVSSDSPLLLTAAPVEWLARIVLIELGVSAGLFVVPLQVVLQAAPPDGQKGRMIGTMNLVNWIGILLSAVCYGVFELLRSQIDSLIVAEIRPATVFSALAMLIAVVAVAYRPEDFDLKPVRGASSQVDE